jgi:CheY-like chemotaxis protein
MNAPRRILVVEDDARIAQLLLDYLRNDGHQAQALADGELALSEIRQVPPDLLILDLMLPGPRRREPVPCRAAVQRRAHPDADCASG